MVPDPVPPDIGADPERLSSSTARTRVVGTLLVLVAAIAFSTKAVLVKLAYRHGLDAPSLLALRFLFSAPFFLVGAYLGGRRPKLTRSEALAIVGLGVAYYAASLCDFIGLRYASAALERMILFVYPTLVVVAEACLFSLRFGRRDIVALVVTYGGILIAFFGELGDRGPDALRGAAWVFACAINYAIYLVGAGRLIPKLGSRRFTSLALLAATFATLVHAGAADAKLLGRPIEAYGIGLVTALVATVAPAFLLTRGIALIGSGPAAIVSTVGPVSTILLAYAFLQERVSAFQVVGTAFVVLGATLIAWRGGQTLHAGRLGEAAPPAPPVPQPPPV